MRTIKFLLICAATVAGFFLSLINGSVEISSAQIFFGVEDEATYIYLRDECNADVIQGFYFGYPETTDVFVKRFNK